MGEVALLMHPCHQMGLQSNRMIHMIEEPLEWWAKDLWTNGIHRDIFASMSLVRKWK